MKKFPGEQRFNLYILTSAAQPCATITEPICPRVCALQQEKPPQGETHTPQIEKSPHSNENPAQPKNTWINKIILKDK